MHTIIEELKEPPGFHIMFKDGAFQTGRNIMTIDGKFVFVNPFGDARVAPEFDTFDLAMGFAFADVECQRNSR